MEFSFLCPILRSRKLDFQWSFTVLWERIGRQRHCATIEIRDSGREWHPTQRFTIDDRRLKPSKTYDSWSPSTIPNCDLRSMKQRSTIDETTIRDRWNNDSRSLKQRFAIDETTIRDRWNNDSRLCNSLACKQRCCLTQLGRKKGSFFSTLQYAVTHICQKVKSQKKKFLFNSQYAVKKLSLKKKEVSFQFTICCQTNKVQVKSQKKKFLFNSQYAVWTKDETSSKRRWKARDSRCQKRRTKGLLFCFPQKKRFRCAFFV